MKLRTFCPRSMWKWNLSAIWWLCWKCLVNFQPSNQCTNYTKHLAGTDWLCYAGESDISSTLSKSTPSSHIVLIADKLQKVRKSKICEVNGTDEIIITQRFKKDRAKLDYSKRFFNCDPSQCKGMYNGVGRLCSVLWPFVISIWSLFFFFNKASV